MLVCTEVPGGMSWYALGIAISHHVSMVSVDAPVEML